LSAARAPRGRLLLLGCRGCGKSSVARAVSELTGLGSADTDDAVEALTGKPVAALLAAGERRFRELEREALLRMLASPARVISIGGGVPLADSNRAALSAIPTRIWLTATPAELRRRLSADPQTAARRPALLGGSPLDEIEQVLALRGPLYAALATHTLATDGLSVAWAAERALEIWLAAAEAAHEPA
jgi:shikimate kinase